MVNFCLTWRLYSLSNSVDTALSIGECSIFLCKTSTRQNDICILTSLGKEDILHNKEVKLLK
jgi:hypothetical protein